MRWVSCWDNLLSRILIRVLGRLNWLVIVSRWWRWSMMWGLGLNSMRYKIRRMRVRQLMRKISKRIIWCSIRMGWDSLNSHKSSMDVDLKYSVSLSIFLRDSKMRSMNEWTFQFNYANLNNWSWVNNFLFCVIYLFIHRLIR